jgi:hypothetical protein
MCPLVLHSISTPLHSLIVVNGAAAIVICLMLRLDLGVVNMILQLQIL